MNDKFKLNGMNKFKISEDGTAMDRVFVTKDAVFRIGDNKPGQPRGYGGQSWYLYRTNGQRELVSDVWRLSDRVNEDITVIRMENEYSPLNDIFFTPTLKYGVEPEDFHVVLLPIFMAKLLAKDFSTVGEAIDMCCTLIENTRGLDSLCFANVVKQLGNVNKEFVYFHTHGDSEQADFDLLNYMYEGGRNLKDFVRLVETPRWQHSMAPFEEVLADLKTWYFRSLCDDSPMSGFTEKLVELRGKLGA